MRDDRASFVKSQLSMHNHQELDALGATARGDAYAEQKRRELEDDSLSSSDNLHQVTHTTREKDYYEQDTYVPSHDQAPYSGYSSPAPPSRGHQQQYHSQESGGGGNQWQRGVGF